MKGSGVDKCKDLSKMLFLTDCEVNCSFNLFGSSHHKYAILAFSTLARAARASIVPTLSPNPVQMGLSNRYSLLDETKHVPTNISKNKNMLLNP
jgi:hypothetical protein